MSLRSVESLRSEKQETGSSDPGLSRQTEREDQQQYILNLLRRVALFAKQSDSLSLCCLLRQVFLAVLDRQPAIQFLVYCFGLSKQIGNNLSRSLTALSSRCFGTAARPHPSFRWPQSVQSDDPRTRPLCFVTSEQSGTEDRQQADCVQKHPLGVI